MRNDTGKYLRGKDLGLAAEQEYVVWDTNSSGPVPRGAAGAAPALEGAYAVNGIACKTAFELLKELCATYTPQETSEITGVASDLIIGLAKRIGTARETTFVTHMGFTRTFHGDISLRALGTVATVTGNVMATFKGGYLPAVLNWNPFLKAVPEKPSYSRMGILQLYDAIISGKPYPVRAVWFSFINFLNQCAHSGKIEKEVFANLDFIVDTELFMTPTARFADILLPVCSYLEFSDLVPHPYPYVQYQQKVMEPLYESRSDADIAAGLAQRLGFAEYFSGGEEGFVDLLLDYKDPSLEGITREKLMQGAMPVNAMPEMDQAFDSPFSTPSGKIEIYSEALKEDGQALPFQLDPLESPIPGKETKYPLAFIQGHSRFRTHSMFANVDALLELNPEPVVEINPRDAGARDICDGDQVVVRQMVWLSLTFLMFVGVLIYFVKRPLGNYLEHRHTGIKSAIEEARLAKEEAESKKREYEQRLQQLDGEVTKLKAEFEARGRAEMERLEVAGKATAERILKDAESTIAADYARAQDALKAEAARLAVELAEQRITAALTANDEAQLRQGFIAEIAS